MNNEYAQKSTDAVEANEMERSPAVNDFTVVDLNGYKKVLYISNVAKPGQLPEDIQERLKEDNRLQIVYNTFDDNYNSETPIYNALISMHQGDEIKFKPSIKSEAPVLPIRLFEIHDNMEEAFSALEKISEQESLNQENQAPETDPTVIHVQD